MKKLKWIIFGIVFIGVIFSIFVSESGKQGIIDVIIGIIWGQI